MLYEEKNIIIPNPTKSIVVNIHCFALLFLEIIVSIMGKLNNPIHIINRSVIISTPAPKATKVKK